MLKFFYKAKQSDGMIVNGTLDGTDEGEVRIKLRARNLIPLQVQEVGGQAKALVNKEAISARELQIFTRQFSTLVNAGIPIVDALKMLGEGKRNPVLKSVAIRVRQSIEGGRRLADSMAAYPGVFDRLYVNMVHAGEEAGILDGILGRLAVYLEKSEKIKKQVKGALVYPAGIIVVAVLVISGILIFIMPKFKELYASSGHELPALTQFVMNFSDFLVKKWMQLLVGIVGSGLTLRWYLRTPAGREQFDHISIQIPLFGDLIQKSSVARMSRTMATMLSSGVTVVDALDIASKTSGNRVIEEALVRSKESVLSGKALAVPLMREAVIPDMVTQMINIGEKSGTMDTMFGKIADFYEEDVEAAVSTLTSLIEPILMVILGGVIAVLVLAMYMPIFNMASMGGG